MTLQTSLIQHLEINDEFKNLIPPLTKDEFSLLEQSILQEGCRDSLVLWGNIIVDGHNRYAICQKHEIKFNTVQREFESKEEASNWIIDNQLARRNLTVEKKKYLVGKKYQLEKNTHGGDRRSNKSSSDFPNLKEKPRKKTVEKIADEYKIHKDTVIEADKYAKAIDVIVENTTPEIKDIILNREIQSTAQEVQILAKYKPEDQKKVVEQIINEVKNPVSGKVKLKTVKRDINQKNRAEKAKQKPELPQDQFNIIYADPPWKYNFAETGNREIENNYPTMDLEDIKELKIPNADNAVLLLWATAPKLIEALEVMKAWGFEYKTCAVWDKEIIGMGYWFRGQHELLLVGVRGSFSPPDNSARISSVIQEKRTKHSKKPKIVYEIIEKMFPNQKYLELFAREQFNENWTIWGNEI